MKHGDFLEPSVPCVFLWNISKHVSARATSFGENFLNRILLWRGTTDIACYDYRPSA